MNRELATALLFPCLLAGTSTGAGEGDDGRLAFEKWTETCAVDRPWEELPELSSQTRRHRGAVAHVSDRLKRGGIPKEALGHFYEDLGRLLSLENAERVLESQPAFRDYQENFKVDVFRLWQQLITNQDADPVRWDASFNEIYYSQADAAGIPFGVRMPPELEGRETYPMLVVLNGGPRVSPGPEFPFIQVRPTRGRIWGYRAISGYDVMEVIAFMKRHYPVDEDRVYLVGSSAGASAAMHLASWNSDRFAAVLGLVAMGTDYPLVNFRNLPVAIHHGDVDWTSAICNARVQTRRFQKLGCPVILKEYAGAGHSVPLPHEPLVSWLFEHERDPSPARITHECEAPALGRSHWIDIREFEDPHRRAFVDASASFSDGVGTVRVQPRNVTALSLDLALAGNGKGRVGTVEIGGDRLVMEATPGRLDCRFREDRWQVVSERESDEPRAKRLYQAGAATNLYQGEPLLIVYGTGSEQASRVKLLRSAALRLATCGGPTFALMPDRFPVLADIDLTAEQQANCNLLLVGTPQENRVTQSLFPRLPIAIREEKLIAGDRPPLPLEDQILGLLHPHPDHPKRFIYLLAPFVDEKGLARFGNAPQKFLAGPDGFDRVSQADLLVQNLDHQIGRQMQFGKDWEWIAMPGNDQPVPERLGDRSHLVTEFLKIMKRKSGADFALWWGPADKGMWGFDFNFLKAFQPEFCTEADLRTQHRIAETMTGGVSGMELKEIWDRWGKSRELQCVPAIQIDAVDDQKEYRLNIPMDLYIKLGQRKKNLNDPEPGPAVAFEEIRGEIFK